MPADPEGLVSDGIGDACQCGDVTDNGEVNMADRDLIITAASDPNVALVAPEKCPQPPGPFPCGAGIAAAIFASVHVPGASTVHQSCGPAVTAFPQDQDGDGILDWLDNCPFDPREDVTDTDGDGVGDLCDNCLTVMNPRLTAAALAEDPWITTTGGQRDDDADGYGNRCDGKFVGGSVVSGLDKFRLHSQLGQPVAGSTCDPTGDQPCARYDVNEDGAYVISGLDLNYFVNELLGMLLFDPNTPVKCEACPLECAGANCP